MDTFNQALCAFFHLAFSPFARLNPWWGLLSISAAAGAIMLFVFRAASDQEKIRALRDRIKAHLLEIRLFKDDLGLLVEAQKGIIRCNLMYLRQCAVPALVLLVPMLLLMVQTGIWFDRRPLAVDESAVVTLKFQDHGSFDEHAALRASSGVTVETLPLRIPEERAVMWRIRAETRGSFELECETRTGLVSKSVRVDDALSGISVRRVSPGFFTQLLHAAEKSLPRDSEIAYLEVAYPRISYQLGSITFHWVVIFLFVSLLVALLLKWICRVEL